jgi:hypothetical protein
MKVAVIGSREIDNINLARHLPDECDEIVSGGARGVDTLAANYARSTGKKLTVFRPDYDAHGRAAPIIRNREIVNYSDAVIAFWDGASRGTAFVIDYCKKVGKPCKVVRMRRIGSSSK